MNRRALRLLLLPGLSHYSDGVLLALRLVVGTFLVWGVGDNILSAERMDEFTGFLTHHGFPAAAFMARLSVWAQFFIGLAFIAGLTTRWAGIVCAVNFIVAIVMVDALGGVRAAFPSACLVLIGLYLATNGAGRFSLDRLVEGNLKNDDTP